MNSRVKILLVFIIFTAIAVFFHLFSPKIVDLDSFFYLGLAKNIQESGFWNSTFPWTTASVIKEQSASLWWPFAVFMLPFSFFENTGMAIKIAGIILTTLALFSLFYFLRRKKMIYPIFWPILAFFSAPNVLSQFLMIRPQTISLALTPLLLMFSVDGQWLGTLLIAFGISWFHFNFFWLTIFIWLAVTSAHWIIERKFYWQTGIATIGGILMGWLIRPNPLGAIKLFYVQVIQQILEKQSGLPLLFGKENFPLPPSTLFQNFSVFLIIWLAAILIFIWLLWSRHKIAEFSSRVILWSSGFISAVFFLLSIIVARRTYNFWIIFGTIFIAAVFSYILPLVPFNRQKTIRSAALGALTLAALFLIPYSGLKTAAALENESYPPDYLKAPALWLKEHSHPGEIVFNIHWANFSPLFYWNRQNYYIGGLDPIFQYSYNPTLYWKFHYLSADQLTDYTCPADACTRSMLEPTPFVLKRDFKANYVLIEKKHNPEVSGYLEKAMEFEKVFEDAAAVIYKIQK